MTVDKCSTMPNMVFYRQSGCGTKYYTNTDTNETHCQCGVDADFPHTCEQEYDTSKLAQGSVLSIKASCIEKAIAQITLLIPYLRGATDANLDSNIVPVLEKVQKEIAEIAQMLSGGIK